MNKIILNNKYLDNFSLKNHEFLVNSEYYNLRSGQQEFRLYSYLTTFFNNSIILDIGTGPGTSAVALSHNDTNKVISYDISHEYPIQDHQHNIYKKKNIEFKICNVLDDLTLDFVSKCKIVMIDIDHLGVIEMEIIKRLYELDFSGIILLDDIHHPQQCQWINTDDMHRLWNSIPYKKYNVSKYGHVSGTGLVLMNCNLEIILK